MVVDRLVAGGWASKSSHNPVTFQRAGSDRPPFQ
jgi:hypothetical protein